MALTEAEKLDVSMILGVTYVDVNDKITNLGATYITAEVETKIREELTRWETAGIDFVSVEPKEANFGARISPGLAKADIRSRLASLLYFNTLAFGADYGRSLRG